jgi:ParB family transcriptional regulator, chromosome partitioning protein
VSPGVARLTEKLGANVVESLAIRRDGNGEGDGARVIAPPSAVPVNRHQGLARIKGAFLVPMDRLAPDPEQPRTEMDAAALEQLAGSLKERGQLMPVRVRWDEATARFVIVSGERRFRAALIAGLPTLQCVETDSPLSADERLEEQLVENCVREDLSPLDQARAFQALMNHQNLTQRELAAKLHVSQAAISKAVGLLMMPEALQDDVESGALPPSTALEIAKERDPGKRETLAQEAKAGRAQRERLRAARGNASRATYQVPGGRVVVTLDASGAAPADFEAAVLALIARWKTEKRQRRAS